MAMLGSQNGYGYENGYCFLYFPSLVLYHISNKCVFSLDVKFNI